MKNRFISALLALVLCIGLMPAAAFAADSSQSSIGAFSNFAAVRSYRGEFQDVPEGKWYYSSVVSAYELGLVNGVNGNSFAPGKSITIAESLALACRLYSTYTGDGYVFEQTFPWYQSYVDYAFSRFLTYRGPSLNYSAAATRTDFAGIMGSLPEEMLQSINTIQDQAIPEVSEDNGSRDKIYVLYRAGILTGSDQKGSFHPDSTITRGEVATIVARIATPSLRQRVNLSTTFSTLYSDNGTTIQVPAWDTRRYKQLQNWGWRTAPFKVSGSKAETLLNSASLNPMKTNNAELDGMIDRIFSQIITKDMTTYQKVKACYDYLVRNFVYGHEITTDVTVDEVYESAKDDFYVNMALEILKTGNGSCRNYSSVFLAMTRRIGLESYIYSGNARKADGSYAFHYWNVIVLGGNDYIFDPQIEGKNTKPDKKITYFRFFKTPEDQAENYQDYDAAQCKTYFNGFKLAPLWASRRYYSGWFSPFWDDFFD